MDHGSHHNSSSCPHLAGVAPDPPVWELAGGWVMGTRGSCSYNPHPHMCTDPHPHNAGMLDQQHDVGLALRHEGMRAWQPLTGQGWTCGEPRHSVTPTHSSHVLNLIIHPYTGLGDYIPGNLYLTNPQPDQWVTGTAQSYRLPTPKPPSTLRPNPWIATQDHNPSRQDREPVTS